MFTSLYIQYPIHLIQPVGSQKMPNKTTNILWTYIASEISPSTNSAPFYDRGLVRIDYALQDAELT